MKLLASYFDNLKKYVSPQNIFDADFKLAKDFGLHLKRPGFHEFGSLIFPDVPIGFIAQLYPGLFTTGSGIETEEGDSYLMSFDFGIGVLKQLRGKIPDQAIELLLQRDEGHRRSVQFADGMFRVTVDCHVGGDLQENEDEIFLPFIINRIL